MVSTDQQPMGAKVGSNTSTRRAIPPLNGQLGYPIAGLFYDRFRRITVRRDRGEDLVRLTAQGRAYLERRFPRDGRR